MTERRPAINQPVGESLRQAISAARAGDKQRARELLNQVIEEEPDHEQALLWSAALADTLDAAFWFLQRLLLIDPASSRAERMLSLHEVRESLKAPRPEETLGPLAAAQRGAGQWQCALCLEQAAEPPDRCPRCRSVTSLADIDAISRNEGVDDNLVSEAASAFSKHAAVSPDYESCLHLALALLNLKRSAEALPWLEKACEFRPSDPVLAQAFHNLERRPLVLAVDDSRTARRVISLILEQNGCRTVVASDGMQALARLNEIVPHLVVLDVIMPGMNGYQLCRLIRKNPYVRHVPVVTLSGSGGRLDRLKSRLAGASEHLLKPLDEEALLRAVRKHALSGERE